MRILNCIVSVILVLPISVKAQIHPTKESLKGLYPGKTYSPYAQRSFPSNVYWGDTHVHTSLSVDAGLSGNTLGMEEAYEETVDSTVEKKSFHPLDCQ